MLKPFLSVLMNLSLCYNKLLSYKLILNEYYNIWTHKSALRKYADFSGRLSRRGYWNFSSASFLIAFGIGIIEGIISGEIADFGSFSYKEIEFNWLTSIYSLAIFVPSYAALSRRLHDTNKSFKNLWLILIPIVGVIILLVFMLKKGDQKENTYGPVPTE